MIYGVLFFLLNTFLETKTENASFIAFTVVILFNLIFDRVLRNYYVHHLQSPFKFQRLKQKQILEALIQNLVGSIRYQEVKKLLFEAFEKLLPKSAHVFYIWDSGQFYLSHYANIDHSKKLPITIESSFFKNIDLNQEHIDLNKLSFLGEDKIKILKSLNLTSIFIFTGHNQAFAFLLTIPEAKRMLNREPIKSSFVRVQKKAGLILENTGLFIDLKRKKMAENHE